jgi:ribosome biogenesis GTPase
MTVEPSLEGLVVTTYRHRQAVRLPDGNTVPTRVKGRRLRPVCGDKVSVEPLRNENEWLLTGISPRRNQLTRPNVRGETEILAANLTLLVAVAADPPKPDWFIVDRYLCAAEIMGINAAVVYNKADLAIDSEPPAKILD